MEKLEFEVLKEAHSLGLIGDQEYKKAIARMLFLNSSINRDRYEKMVDDISYKRI